MTTRRTKCGMLAVAVALLPVIVLGNSMVPGPFIWQGLGRGTDNPLLYVAVMAMVCVGVEGAIYLYMPQFKRPWRSSLIANGFSALIGIPAAFTILIIPEPFFIPTLVTILSECWLLGVTEKPPPPATMRSIIFPVFWANILSNAVIVGVLLYAMEK